MNWDLATGCELLIWYSSAHTGFVYVHPSLEDSLCSYIYMGVNTVNIISMLAITD